jgi:hypothetical protein
MAKTIRDQCYTDCDVTSPMAVRHEAKVPAVTKVTLTLLPAVTRAVTVQICCDFDRLFSIDIFLNAPVTYLYDCMTKL